MKLVIKNLFVPHLYITSATWQNSFFTDICFLASWSQNNESRPAAVLSHQFTVRPEVCPECAWAKHWAYQDTANVNGRQTCPRQRDKAAKVPPVSWSCIIEIKEKWVGEGLRKREKPLPLWHPVPRWMSAMLKPVDGLQSTHLISLGVLTPLFYGGHRNKISLLLYKGQIYWCLQQLKAFLHHQLSQQICTEGKN